MRNVFQEQLAQVTTTGIMSVVPSPLAIVDVHVVHEEYKPYPLWQYKECGNFEQSDDGFLLQRNHFLEPMGIVTAMKKAIESFGKSLDTNSTHLLVSLF